MALKPLSQLTYVGKAGGVEPTSSGVANDKDPNEKAIRRLLRGDTETRLKILEDQEERSVGQLALETLVNAGVEAKDIIHGLGVLGWKAASGSAKIAAKAITSPVDSFDDVISGKAYDTIKDVADTFIGAIKEDYSHRYGPLFRGDFKEAGMRVHDKPLSFLLDATGAMSLAGGGLKALSKPFADAAAGRILTSTGTTLSKLGTTLDPLHLTVEGIKKAGDVLPGLPIIGKNAVALRAAKKQARDMTIEAIEIGKRASEVEQAKVQAVYSALEPWEKEKIQHYLWGFEELPSNARPELKRAVEYHKQIINNPENIEALGVVSEEARRRRIAPVIMKKFYDGELKFTPETESILADSGFIKPGSPLDGLPVQGATKRGRELQFTGGLMDVPEQLFREAEEQLTAAERGATYFPAIEAEAKLKPDRFIFRTGQNFTTIKSGFQKPFTGEMVNRVLRSKDPQVLADAELVMRQYVNDVSMAKTMKKINDDIMTMKDPATGQVAAKKLYLGKTPNNLLAFESGKDMARVVNAMEKPFKGSIDDLYRTSVGVSKADLVSKIKKQNPSFSQRAAESAADDLVLENLGSQKYDGFIITNGENVGRYGFVNPTQHPFGGLLPDHVIYAPQGLLRFFNGQQKLASQVRSKVEAGSHIEEAAYSAVSEMFPEGDGIFNQVKKEYEAASNGGLEMLNTDYINPKQINKAISDFRNALKGTLKDLNINADDAARAVKAYSDKVQHVPGKGHLSVAKNHWVMQIPKVMADSIQDIYKPLFASNGLNTTFKLWFDSPTSAWRMLALNATPRWQVNNFIGNLALNLMAGVLNPVDYARALPYLGYRLANRFPRSIGVPAKKLLSVTGYKGQAMDDLAKTSENLYRQVGMGTFFKSETYPIHLSQAAETPMAKLQSKLSESLLGRSVQKFAVASADFNSIVDSFFRDAHLISGIRGQLNKQNKGLYKKMVGSFYASQDDISKFVNNPNGNNLGELADRVEKWLPNYNKLLTPVEKRFIRRIVPFYSWYKHMLGVTLMMPLRHPKRAAFISQLSKATKDVEESEWEKNGIDPKSVRAVADYLDSSVLVSKDGDTAKFLALRGANPFATILDIPNIGNLMNPFVKAALEQVFQKDLFTMKDFKKEVRLNTDGVPVEVSDRELGRRALDLVPNASAVQKIINPEVYDADGQLMFTRDRQLEALKLLGVNIQERDIAALMEKAAEQKGKNAAKAINQLIKSKRSNPGVELENLLQKVHEKRN